MEADPREREALRQRLYRPDASPADLDAYLDAAEPEQEAPRLPAPRHERSPLRRLVAVGAGAGLALAAALVVGALARGPSAVPDAAGAPSAAPSTAGPRPAGVVDEGVRPHATGRADPEPPHGYLYTIARGDTVAAIAARFRLCAADVYGALPYGVDTARLPPLQQLVLQGHALPPAEYAVPGAC